MYLERRLGSAGGYAWGYCIPKQRPASSSDVAFLTDTLRHLLGRIRGATSGRM